MSTSEDDEDRWSSEDDEEDEDEEDFDDLVSKIAADEPFEDGEVEYYGRIGVERATRLAEALRVNSTVTHLALDGNGLGDDNAALLAGALMTNSFITGVWLQNNNIGDKGARSLAGVLRTNSTLTTLDLRHNNISEKGARALAAALPFNSSLRILDLKSNSIGDEGASALAAALPFNSTLGMLGLSDNNIGPGGATALAEGLHENCSVFELQLVENSIGNDGAKALVVPLLRGNSSLYFITLWNTDSLGNNGVSQELEQLVRELGEINQNAANPQEALERKVEWLASYLDEDDVRLLGLERGSEEVNRIRVETEIGWKLNSENSAEDEAAVSLALSELGGFPLAVHHRRLFGRLLGSRKHGVRIASSVGEVGVRALYRKAAECGAAPGVLMNLLRAHPSLCACRDVKHKLYPFMVLATMSEAGVDEVMELLLQSPHLVQSGVDRPSEHQGQLDGP